MQLLTVKQAAQRLAIGRSLLYQLIQRGEIRSVVIGRRARRISVTALDEWIEQQQAEAQSGQDLE